MNIKLGFVKKLIVKSALGIARLFVTPEMLKEEARKALTDVAARAHSGDTTRGLVERTKNILATMEDGVVNAEEVEMVLGDVITQENIDKVFAYVEGKVS